MKSITRSAPMLPSPEEKDQCAEKVCPREWRYAARELESSSGIVPFSKNSSISLSSALSSHQFDQLLVRFLDLRPHACRDLSLPFPLPFPPNS